MANFATIAREQEVHRLLIERVLLNQLELMRFAYDQQDENYLLRRNMRESYNETVKLFNELNGSGMTLGYMT